MQLDVALIPSDLQRVEGSVCIVVDALRASSTIATLFGRGVDGVIVAGTIADARTIHAAIPDALLCGESGGLPPEGFHYGNSPIEFEGLDLAGRTVVLATSNGTRALAGLAAAKAAFVGSLLNLSACARAAWSAAGPADTITVVCAGNEHGSVFSLEDTVVAGALVERIVREAGVAAEGAITLSDRATAAYRLWRSYPGGARLAFGESFHGQYLASIDMAEDLDFCAQIDRYAVAPRLTVAADGRYLLS